MKTFVFDDRFVLPSYFGIFLDCLSAHEHINIITPAKLIISVDGSLESLINSQSLSFIDPKSLVNYDLIKNCFAFDFFNYSTGETSFELACFLRWFAINQATPEMNDSEFICLVDSDFLLACSPSLILESVQDQSGSNPIEFISTWPKDRSHIINPQITIITKRLLHSFCQYLFSDYFSLSNRSIRMREWFETIGRCNPGGLCDMTALGSWLSIIKPSKYNLSDLDGFVFVDNFNSLVVQQSIANACWSLEIAYDSQTFISNNKHILVSGTHFQGSAKTRISRSRLSSSKVLKLSDHTPTPVNQRLRFQLKLLLKLLLVIGSFASSTYSLYLKPFIPLGDRLK